MRLGARSSAIARLTLRSRTLPCLAELRRGGNLQLLRLFARSRGAAHSHRLPAGTKDELFAGFCGTGWVLPSHIFTGLEQNGDQYLH